MEETFLLENCIERLLSFFGRSNKLLSTLFVYPLPLQRQVSFMTKYPLN